MATTSLDSTATDILAEKLQEDMRRRGLRPGERYLTAAEAGEMLEVSTASADRAMQLLAKRMTLIRQRSRGTFVGPGFRNGFDTHTPLDIVHVMMSIDYYYSHIVTSEDFVDALSKSIPGAAVQMHFMPDHDAFPYCQRVVAKTQSQRDSREAFLLVRSSRQVQQFMEQSDYPTVIFGNTYPGINLPCVTHDQVAVGKMMADYALDCGHSRFILLMRNEWRCGDNLMCNGATQALAARNVDMSKLEVRSVPPEKEHVSSEVRPMLTKDSSRVAFLCRVETHGDIIVDLCNETGLKNGRDVIVVTGGQANVVGKPNFATVLATVEKHKVVEQAGKMLAQIATHGRADPDTVVIPICLQGPTNGPIEGYVSCT